MNSNPNCRWHSADQQELCSAWKRAVADWLAHPVGGPMLQMIEDKRIGEVNRRARLAVGLGVQPIGLDTMHKDEAAIQQRRLTEQQDPQPAGGARVYLAAVIEAYDEFTQIIAPDIELYPIDVYVEQARQYMIEAQ